MGGASGGGGMPGASRAPRPAHIAPSRAPKLTLSPPFLSSVRHVAAHVDDGRRRRCGRRRRRRRRGHARPGRNDEDDGRRALMPSLPSSLRPSFPPAPTPAGQGFAARPSSDEGSRPSGRDARRVYARAARGRSRARPSDGSHSRAAHISHDLPSSAVPHGRLTSSLFKCRSIAIQAREGIGRGGRAGGRRRGAFTGRPAAQSRTRGCPRSLAGCPR